VEGTKKKPETKTGAMEFGPWKGKSRKKRKTKGKMQEKGLKGGPRGERQVVNLKNTDIKWKDGTNAERGSPKMTKRLQISKRSEKKDQKV